MSSDAVLDFESLLSPITEESPAGNGLREHDAAAYFEIKRLRDGARKAETQFFGDSEGTDETENWEQVFTLSEAAIRESSKDLQVAAWLIEALVRIHGFAGLRDGLRLARELSEKFWDGIHPRPDEDGVETTVAPLAGLNGEEADGPLVSAIGLIPATEGSTYGPFALWRFKQAHELDRQSPDKQEQRLSDGWVSLEMFNRSVTETSADFFRTLLEDIEATQTELAAMERVLEEKCGKDADGFPLAPPTSRLRDALEDALRTVKGFSQETLGDAAEAAAEEQAASSDEDGDSGGTAGPSAGVSQKQIRTREDAFRTLLEIASFFKKSEPHSPVSYGLEQVVRWGRMSLPELLADLISDSSTREALFRQVGIPEPRDDD